MPPLVSHRVHAVTLWTLDDVTNLAMTHQQIQTRRAHHVTRERKVGRAPFLAHHAAWQLAITTGP